MKKILEKILHLCCVCPLSYAFWRDMEKFVPSRLDPEILSQNLKVMINTATSKIHFQQTQIRI